MSCMAFPFCEVPVLKVLQAIKGTEYKMGIGGDVRSRQLHEEKSTRKAGERSD